MLMKRFTHQVCQFYNYDPKTKICELNNKTPEDSPALPEHKKDWETWIAVEPHYDNYRESVRSFQRGFGAKLCSQDILLLTDKSIICTHNWRALFQIPNLRFVEG